MLILFCVSNNQSTAIRHCINAGIYVAKLNSGVLFLGLVANL